MEAEDIYGLVPSFSHPSLGMRLGHLDTLAPAHYPPHCAHHCAQTTTYCANMGTHCKYGWSLQMRPLGACMASLPQAHHPGSIILSAVNTIILAMCEYVHTPNSKAFHTV